MKNECENDVLDEVLQRLQDAVVGLKKIILFGSRASGMADAGSDIDLIVIVENDLPRGELFIQVSRSFRGLGVAFDLVVLTPAEFGSNSRKSWTVAAAASDRGKVLYEAA